MMSDDGTGSTQPDRAAKDAHDRRLAATRHTWPVPLRFRLRRIRFWPSYPPQAPGGWWMNDDERG